MKDNHDLSFFLSSVCMRHGGLLWWQVVAVCSTGRGNHHWWGKELKWKNRFHENVRINVCLWLVFIHHQPNGVADWRCLYCIPIAVSWHVALIQKIERNFQNYFKMVAWMMMVRVIVMVFDVLSPGHPGWTTGRWVWWCRVVMEIVSIFSTSKTIEWNKTKTHK